MSPDPAESPASGIVYTLSLADFLAAKRALAWNGIFGPATHWIRFLIISVVVVACWAVPIIAAMKVRSPSHWPLLTILVALAGVAAWTLALWVVDLLVARFLFGRIALSNTKVTLNFEADGIHYQTPSDTGVLSWSGIRRVVTRPGYLLLCISKSEALTLPRRAFTSDTAFDDTLRYVLARTETGAAR